MDTWKGPSFGLFDFLAQCRDRAHSTYHITKHCVMFPEPETSQLCFAPVVRQNGFTGALAQFRIDFEPKTGAALIEQLSSSLSHLKRMWQVHEDQIALKDVCLKNGDVFRFQRVHRARHAGLDVAERAGAGADIAQDHHRRVLLGPAFADVRASRLFAHGMQVEIAHQRARFAIALAGWRLDPDPFGLALALVCRRVR